MKPIIIIKETNKDGKFELTENELKEIVEQSYKQGFEDGKQERVNVQGVPLWRSVEEPFTLNNPHDIYGYPTHYYSGTTTSGQPNPEIKLNSTSESTGV